MCVQIVGKKVCIKYALALFLLSINQYNPKYEFDRRVLKKKVLPLFFQKHRISIIWIIFELHSRMTLTEKNSGCKV